MTAFWNRAALGSAMALLLGVGVCLAQPPKDEAKKDEPPSKEEKELQRGSRDLAYKFAVGEEIHAEAKQKRIEHRNVQGKTRPDTKELLLKMILTIDALLPNGGAEISARVTNVKYNRVGIEILKYDDKNPKNADNQSDGWELYSKARFKFKVDARGNVTDIRPDSETASWWKDQPRELRALVADEVVRSFLPFFTLPSELVRRGTDWKQVRTFVEEFGKRELTIDFSYHGSETISGRTYEEIRLRGKAKQSDQKPKWNIDEQRANGKISFDMAHGILKSANFEEHYVFHQADTPESLAAEKAKLEKEKKEKEKKDKNKKGSSMGGSGAPGGRGGSGMGSMSGGYPGMGNKGKGKEQKKKKEEEEEAMPERVVQVEIQHDWTVTYRGKPISSE